MPLDLCGNCPKPGMCCRDIRLHTGNDIVFRGVATRLEALVALATVRHEDPWMGHIGLPFLPDRIDGLGMWVLQCPILGSDGRCTDYENRPLLCRHHEPGFHVPCALTKPEPLRPPVGNDVLEDAMGLERTSRDRLSPAQRSRLMSRIRSEGTRPESMLAHAMLAAGLRFDSHARDLPGRPDFVLREERIAVFADGDFWHGWKFPAWREALSPFWRDKIAANRRRDRRVGRALRGSGWTVVRLWEHKITADAAACARAISRLARRRRAEAPRPPPSPR